MNGWLLYPFYVSFGEFVGPSVSLLPSVSVNEGFWKGELMDGPLHFCLLPFISRVFTSVGRACVVRTGI